jgi:site-specific DNA-cytosine methylase
MARVTRTPSQKGARVDEAFKSLLDDPMINRFLPSAKSMSHLCQRWGREIAATPEEYAHLLDGLRASPPAATRIANSDLYASYNMADVRKASNAKRFTAVSLFAGGGGSSIGYRLAGGFVSLMSEFVPEAAKTYQLNFPETAIDRRDIRDVLCSQGGGAAFLDQAGLQPDEIDILDGSPPCSEFSSVGAGIRDKHVMHAYSDVRQKDIASLPFDCVELAVALNPKLVVLENVPPLATKYRHVLDNLLSELSFPKGTSGPRHYFAAHSILTADDFGVAQQRKRLFIIGVRTDVADAIGIDSDRAVLPLFPIPTHSPVSIRAAFANLHQTAFDVEPWQRTMMASSSLLSAVRRLPRCPKKRTRLSHVSPGDHSKFTLTRCSYDLPAPTLTVFGQQPNGMTGVIHPEHDRKFTIPELKRLFGLPDDYALTGTLGQAAERICRMVPPFLTQAIAESLHENVLRPFKEKCNA